MNQQHRLSQPRYTLALLAGLMAATCAKAEDNAPDGSDGAGGSGGTGLTSNGTMGTSASHTTTSSTASAATATATAAAATATTANAASGSSTTTSGGGTQGGEAGAPADTSSTNDGAGGSGGAGTEGSVSTTGVPPDVIENAEVVLLYKVDSASETTNSIFMHLYLRNQSDDDFPLNAAEVRYWLDPDGLNFTMASHYQGPGIGAVTLSKGSDGDDDYVAVTFAATAVLAGNTTDINRNEFQLKLDAAGGLFDQTNDYSFAAITSMTEHDRITVYLADELVWGCEPSGACAGDDPGAGGAAGAAGAEG